MLRPLTDSVPLVFAEGKVIHGGRQFDTAEGRIVGPDGKLYAHATRTGLAQTLGNPVNLVLNPDCCQIQTCSV